jgi:hypothetical protein
MDPLVKLSHRSPDVVPFSWMFTENDFFSERFLPAEKFNKAFHRFELEYSRPFSFFHIF